MVELVEQIIAILEKRLLVKMDVHHIVYHQIIVVVRRCTDVAVWAKVLAKQEDIALVIAHAQQPLQLQHVNLLVQCVLPVANAVQIIAI